MPFVSFPRIGCLLLLTASSTSALQDTSSFRNVPSEKDFTFDDWLQLFPNKPLEWRKEEEDSFEWRRQIWNDNAVRVRAHNEALEAGHTTYAMTMTSPFADLTDDEFTARYLMESQNCSATASTTTSSSSLLPQKLLPPELESPHDDDDGTTPLSYAQSCHCHVDWRTKGIVTPIKNQKSCGSCWTFSTTGCLEAHTCLAYGKDCTHWTGYSEQQLLDCAGDYNNHGCNGGLPSQAYEYIKNAGGLELDQDYPYHANETGTCRSKTSSHKALPYTKGQVAEVYNITKNDEDDLVHAIATLGPVSIAYQVSHDFRFYSHGVYDSYNATTNETMCHNLPSDVNHAVVAVGLDTTEPSQEHPHGVPFYIVRNSWGTSWGMEGYFWMKRGENLCGVSDCASFPLVPVNQAQESLLRGSQGVSAAAVN